MTALEITTLRGYLQWIPAFAGMTASLICHKNSVNHSKNNHIDDEL